MKTPLKAAAAIFLISRTIFCSGQTPDTLNESERILASEIREVLPRPDTLSMSFIGDIMLHSSQIENAGKRFRENMPGTYDPHQAFDFSPYFMDIRDSLEKPDIAVANMEFTLAGEPFTGYPSFSAPDSYADYIADCGIDIFLTANNHILDKGRHGIARTMARYGELGQRKGIHVTGASSDETRYLNENPLIIQRKGMKIAFVNMTYGTNASVAGEYPKVNRISDRKGMETLMERAEASDPDFTVVLPHWGSEYVMSHSESQERLAEWLAGKGADIIIGAHPHVIQDSSTVKVTAADGGSRNVPVFYSLGNAISNMSAKDTQTGLLVNVRVIKEMNGKTRIHSIGCSYMWCSLPGRLTDSHCTILVKDYIGKRHLWKMPYEYDKMIQTYERVRRTTGILDSSIILKTTEKDG